MSNNKAIELCAQPLGLAASACLTCFAFALWPGWQLAPFNQRLLRAALCMTDLDAVWSTRAGTSSLMAGSEVERASNGGTKLKLPL